MIDAHILRAFTDDAGDFGSSAGVVIDDGRDLNDNSRRSIARRLGYEETVFVNDARNADVSVFNLREEIKFAGVPMVGASWLLGKIKGEPIAAIHCLGGEVQTWQNHGLTWLRASLTAMPPWNHVQLDNAAAIERITAEEGARMLHTMAWAWIDKSKGLIRARTFMNDWEIPEAEGNGSGSMMLAATLNRSIEVRHGLGSVIFAKSAGDNCAEVGGRVVQDEDLAF